MYQSVGMSYPSTALWRVISDQPTKPCVSLFRQQLIALPSGSLFYSTLNPPQADFYDTPYTHRLNSPFPVLASWIPVFRRALRWVVCLSLPILLVSAISFNSLTLGTQRAPRSVIPSHISLWSSGSICPAVYQTSCLLVTAIQTQHSRLY